LVKRYEKPLFNYICRMLGGTADADDVFQETFLRVYRHMDRFWNQGVFRPWIYRIATNLCRDHLRKRSRHPRMSLDTAGPEGTPLQERLESARPGPGEQARETELVGALESALGELPEKHRAVFLMARYDGMRYEEIASALHIPVGTVKSRMNKAVKVLLESVEQVMQ
jgi:RNA polymerase sigma-70 factor (ECF subfamily)